MQLANHFYKITNNKALQFSVLVGLGGKMWSTSQDQFLCVEKLLEIWVDVEWFKEQQHQIKDETVLFLQ